MTASRGTAVPVAVPLDAADGLALVVDYADYGDERDYAGPRIAADGTWHTFDGGASAAERAEGGSERLERWAELADEIEAAVAEVRAHIVQSA